MSPASVKPRLQETRQRPGTAVLDKGLQSAATVLDAAAALLAEEGAAGLSMHKVAARAGMHAGNLPYYFRTKQDIVDAEVAGGRRVIAKPERPLQPSPSCATSAVLSVKWTSSITRPATFSVVNVDPSTLTLRPVAGKPKRSPRWVPVITQRSACR